MRQQKQQILDFIDEDTLMTNARNVNAGNAPAANLMQIKQNVQNPNLANQTQTRMQMRM